jgi:hypothetical protein
MSKSLPIGPYTRRILRWYDRATPEQRIEGVAWYGHARTFAADLARTYGHDLDQVAALIAVLSPQCDWDQNKLAAVNACARHRDGLKDLPGYTGYGANVAKAFRILSGDLSALKGPKVEAFAAAIRGDLSHVVIDAWAARAARSSSDNLAKLFRSDEMPGTRERRAMAEGYRRAAAARGVDPAAMQAAVWVAVRESGVYAKPPKDERASARWYARQNRARVAQGLSIITGEYAYQNAPRARAAALQAAAG